jgi:hypothetical protein
MSYLYRSESMEYVSITMTNEVSYSTLQSLGYFSKLHIVDLNANNKETQSKQQIAYKKRLADCLYWEKKLANFREEMAKHNIVLPPDDIKTNEIQSPDLLDELQSFLDPLEKELVLSSAFQKDNNKQINEIIEKKHVLLVTQHVHIQGK